MQGGGARRRAATVQAPSSSHTRRSLCEQQRPVIAPSVLPPRYMAPSNSAIASGDSPSHSASINSRWEPAGSRPPGAVSATKAQGLRHRKVTTSREVKSLCG